jgi:hypothetical protein
VAAAVDSAVACAVAAYLEINALLLHEARGWCVCMGCLQNPKP